MADARLRIKFDHSETLARALPNWAATIVDDTAKLMSREAKQRCPVDTGALRNSIAARKNGLKATVGAGNNNVNYASFVEYGTYKMAAQPFMTPAKEIADRYLKQRLNAIPWSELALRGF